MGYTEGIQSIQRRVYVYEQASHSVTHPLEELLDQLCVFALAAADGKDHLHARAEIDMVHKSAVKPITVVDAIVEDVGATDGEVLVVRETAPLEHVLAHHVTEPDGEDHRHVPDLVGRRLESVFVFVFVFVS